MIQKRTSIYTTKAPSVIKRSASRVAADAVLRCRNRRSGTGGERFEAMPCVLVDGAKYDAGFLRGKAKTESDGRGSRFWPVHSKALILRAGNDFVFARSVSGRRRYTSGQRLCPAQVLCRDAILLILRDQRKRLCFTHTTNCASKTKSLPEKQSRFLKNIVVT